MVILKKGRVKIHICDTCHGNGYIRVAKIDCFDLCEILRLKLSGYVDTLNLHIMSDGSVLIGCMCR